jgi:hypothetical protein
MKRLCQHLLPALVLLHAVSSLAAQKPGVEPPHYIGAGGCSSSNCHGSTTVAPEKTSRVLTTEYAMWAIHDKHADAGKALDNPRSARIAEILGLGKASAAKRCIVCHVSGSPSGAEITPDAARSDGVACEACHGPAGKWLGSHVQPNSHAASMQAGMIDTKDLVVRAKTCLACHLGTPDRVVDHEMIAAGHPDLPFELDTFGWAEPSHAREQPASAGNTLPRTRVWAVGQTVRLSQAMRELARRATTSWPDFAVLECSQCHHDLHAQSWRIQRGYAGRTPGSLQVNPAETEVVRVLVAKVAPGQREAFDGLLDTLASTVATHPGDGAAIAQAARAVEQRADALTNQMLQTDFTKQLAKDLIRAIAADIHRISGQGVYAAEQATMSLDSLAAALSGGDPKVRQTAQQGMDELYARLEHPSAYNAREFAALFLKIAQPFE